MGEVGGHRYHVMDGIGGQWLAETTTEDPEPTGIGRVDDILRAAAPDALKERIEALARERERLALVLHGTDYAHIHAQTARDLRAVLADQPADGSAT